MKQNVKRGVLVLGLFALFSCSTAVKNDTQALKDQLKAKDDQITALDEKLTSMNAAQAKSAQEIADLNAAYSNLMKSMSQSASAGSVKINPEANTINIDFLDKVFFDSGSADIKKDGKAELDKLIPTLKTVKNRVIRVEGYADNVPIAEQFRWKYPSNWELSTARADAIVRYLQEQGIDPTLLKATGYGKFNPVASNDTEEGRAQNRRIAIMLVPMDVRARYK